MGIGDRSYMRGPRPARTPLSATMWTLGVLLACFIVGLIQDSAGADLLGWARLREASPLPWQWLTHALLHDGFWHLVGNGLLLWWTGAIVENTYGRRAYWSVLAAGTLVGGLTWWLSGLGGRSGGELIGASAAVYAMMMVALLDKLEHQVTLLLFFFLPVTVRVRWILLITGLITGLGWAFAELPSRHAWSHWHPSWTDAIAHSAHLGGLVIGWLVWMRLNRTNAEVGYAQEEMEAPRATQAFETEETDLSSDVATPRPNRAQDRAELDRLLDKISAGGFGSLTPADKRRLEELSARLR